MGRKMILDTYKVLYNVLHTSEDGNLFFKLFKIYLFENI